MGDSLTDGLVGLVGVAVTDRGDVEAVAMVVAGGVGAGRVVGGAVGEEVVATTEGVGEVGGVDGGDEVTDDVAGSSLPFFDVVAVVPDPEPLDPEPLDPDPDPPDIGNAVATLSAPAKPNTIENARTAMTWGRKRKNIMTSHQRFLDTTGPPGNDSPRQLTGRCSSGAP